MENLLNGIHGCSGPCWDTVQEAENPQNLPTNTPKKKKKEVRKCTKLFCLWRFELGESPLWHQEAPSGMQVWGGGTALTTPAGRELGMDVPSDAAQWKFLGPFHFPELMERSIKAQATYLSGIHFLVLITASCASTLKRSQQIRLVSNLHHSISLKALDQRI